MEEIRIHLSVLWIVLMLTYLLGDVLRLFAGDFTPGEIQGQRITQAMMMGIAVMMLIPIVMAFLSLTLPYPAIRWVTIVATGFLFVFNIIALPSYPGLYDKFLIVVGLLWNVVTVWTVWNWQPATV